LFASDHDLTGDLPLTENTCVSALKQNGQNVMGFLEQAVMALNKVISCPALLPNPGGQAGILSHGDQSPSFQTAIISCCPKIIHHVISSTY